MAWNEPGGGNKDPWGSNQGNNQGPPELDEIIRKLDERLGRVFRRGGGGGGGGLSGPGGNLSMRAIAVGLAILFVLWLATGFYIVDPAERGVELRFGAYTTMTKPGLHWHLPWPVEEVKIVNVDEISSFRHKAAMLTKDENIVDVELTVQSRIQDAADFLFQDQSPEKTLRDATETVVRKTIGGAKLDFVLTEGRSAIAMTIKERVQSLMDEYQTGLLVTSVNMQPAKPRSRLKRHLTTPSRPARTRSARRTRPRPTPTRSCPRPAVKRRASLPMPRPIEIASSPAPRVRPPASVPC